jgi:DNA polymerase-3 subunit beta
MTFQSPITTPATSIPASELRRVLPILTRVVERRSTIPVLHTIRLTATAGADTLRLIATDLDIEIKARIETITDQDVDLCIPAPVFHMARDGDTLHLACGEIAARMRLGAPPEDFPMMACPGLDDAPGITLSESALHRLLRLARHCVSTKETRYYLKGVFLTSHPERGTLRAVATDGHRLAMIDDDTALPEGWPSMIVPRRAADILLAMTNPQGNAEVTLQATDTRLRAVRDGMTVTTKLIDGTFPDYTRVIPKAEATCRATLNRAGIARLDRAYRAVAGKTMGRAAKLDPEAGQMIMTGPDARVTAPLTIDGDHAIGFNAAYLSEQTRITPTIRIRWANGSDPAIIEAVDEMDHPERDARWILMPMRV